MKNFFYSLLITISVIEQVQAGMICSGLGFDNMRITYYGGVIYSQQGKQKLSGYLIYALNEKPSENLSFTGFSEMIVTRIGLIKEINLNCDYGDKECGINLTDSNITLNEKKSDYSGTLTLDNASHHLHCKDTLLLVSDLK